MLGGDVREVPGWPACCMIWEGQAAAEFRAAGTSRWLRKAIVGVDKKTVAFKFKLPSTRTGRWRLRFLGTLTYAPTVSESALVTVQPTSLIFDAGPEPVRRGTKIRLGGQLMRRTAEWWPLSGRHIRFWFRAKGSSTWNLVGQTTSGEDGRFTRMFKANRDGSWRACFPGIGVARPTCSRADFVDAH